MGSPMSLDLAFPLLLGLVGLLLRIVFSLSGHSSSLLVWLILLFYPLSASLISRVPPIELWDSLSSLENPGIVCLASQSSDWLDALWDSLSSV